MCSWKACSNRSILRDLRAVDSLSIIPPAGSIPLCCCASLYTPAARRTITVLRSRAAGTCSSRAGEQLIARVERGERIIITRHGTPVAVLQPARETPPFPPNRSLLP
ncbi:MAG: type II toxin-antitoxin system Phd/YefM family antitoxin [Anaerolineae bacterium]